VWEFPQVLVLPSVEEASESALLSVLVSATIHC